MKRPSSHEKRQDQRVRVFCLFVFLTHVIDGSGWTINKTLALHIALPRDTTLANFQCMGLGPEARPILPSRGNQKLINSSWRGSIRKENPPLETKEGLGHG